MDITQAIILSRNIYNNLWPKIILVITYVKNIRPTIAL